MSKKPLKETTKTAIVTGVSRGIGKQIALTLEEEGYNVFGVSRKNCDISKEKKIVSFLRQFSHVDVLVNCAGISHYGLIKDTSIEAIDLVYRTNVFGTINFTKHVLPLMKKGGYVFNICSRRGVEFVEGKVAYSTSKSALRAFSLILSKELKKKGVKVTCINPGFVYTDLIKIRIAEEGLKESDILLPVDIAKTIVFLLGLSEGAVVDEITIGEAWR